MLSKEWALIGFTLLSQMAIGAFWIVWLTLLASRQKASEKELRNLTNSMLIGIGPIMALGLLVSFLHLGNPLNSWRAIGNLGSSWLSREIFFALAFFIMWFVTLVMQMRSAGTEGLRSVWAALTAIVGLLAVLASAMIYMLPTRPAWFDMATLLFFFASTLVLGGLAAAVVFVIYYARTGKSSETQTAIIKGALKNISLIVMVVIVIQAIALVGQAVSLTQGTTEAQASAQLLFSTYGIWYWLRVIVGVLAGFVLAWLGWQALTRAETKLPAQVTSLMLATFVCVLIGEVVGRALFYFTVVPVKLPGVL